MDERRSRAAEARLKEVAVLSEEKSSSDWLFIDMFML